MSGNVGWQAIETVPRDATRVLVFVPESRRPVREAWWRIPWDGAAAHRGWWCYDGDGTLLDASVHDVEKSGATHWMPLPDPPERSETAGRP